MNEKLYAARLSKRWTLKRASDVARVGLRTYRYWEGGLHEPTLSSLELLCTGFGMTPDELGFGHLVVPARSPVVIDAGMPDQTAFSGQLELIVPSSPLEVGFKSVPETTDSTIWIGEKAAQIVAIVTHWRRSVLLCADLQQIIDQELITMLDDTPITLPMAQHLEEVRLSRRHALLTLSALPQGLLALVHRSPKGFIDEDFLPSCAASVTACWHLMGGREIIAVERAVSRYLPLLSVWARRPSSSPQQTAASLAAQGCLLQGLAALHLLPSPRNSQVRLSFCQQAVELSRLSGNQELLVVALTHLGSTYAEVGQFQQTLQIHQEAVTLASSISPVLRSKALVELARAYAQVNQENDALRTIGDARNILPSENESLPCYLPDSGIFHFTLVEGQTFLFLGKYHPEGGYNEQAGLSLSQTEYLPKGMIVPERFRVEIVNQRALASLRQKDLEQFHAFSMEGVAGAKTLNSEARRQEVVTNWKEARAIWPREARITELAGLLLE